MAQFQAEVPYPLADELPCLLTRCGIAGPPVRVLLLVFVRQSVFKRAAMQIQRHDITGSKRALGELCHEEFIDHTRTGDPYSTLGDPSRMRCHDDAAPHPLRPQRQIRTVVEGTHHPTDPRWARC
jgi:hypothetical protein